MNQHITYLNIKISGVGGVRRVAVPDTDVICLTIPLPNCCHNPVPEPNGPVDNTVDGRRERIDCILDDSKNGTLLEVFGIDPPCCVEDNK
uniref:Uncharacterized protein n=1 Tax=Glossina palpalis gambiensis TaxID=67801 RepID=A0A1B0B8V5_9MUSC